MKSPQAPKLEETLEIEQTTNVESRKRLVRLWLRLKPHFNWSKAEGHDQENGAFRRKGFGECRSSSFGY
ncbi:hypothetical protein ACLOJK_038037 [Asimina triloba]